MYTQEQQTSGSELREEEFGGKEESQKLKTDQIHQEMEKTNKFPYFFLVPKAENIFFIIAQIKLRKEFMWVDWWSMEDKYYNIYFSF